MIAEFYRCSVAWHVCVSIWNKTWFWCCLAWVFTLRSRTSISRRTWVISALALRLLLSSPFTSDRRKSKACGEPTSIVWSPNDATRMQTARSICFTDCSTLVSEFLLSTIFLNEQMWKMKNLEGFLLLHFAWNWVFSNICVSQTQNRKGGYVSLKVVSKPQGRPQINWQNIPTTGTSHSEISQTPVSTMTLYNNFTVSSRSQSRSTQYRSSKHTQ